MQISMKAEVFRANIADRTGRDLTYYQAMFGELPVLSGQTLVNVGAGDSALGNDLPGVDVIDVDYGYGKLPPLYDPATGRQQPYVGTPIAALARDMPLEDDTSDCTIASFLCMHMGVQGVRRSIDEMIRITAPERKILIGPVWDDAGRAPSLENDHVSFRYGHYTDGRRYGLHSMAITIPEDKSELARLAVSESIARSRVLYNRSLWRSLGLLAGQAMHRAAAGSNRRHDPSGRSFELRQLT